MASSVERLKGSVKWFDRCKGFGFITPEGGGAEIFVHSSSIKAVGRRWLIAGDSVEFVVSINSDGRSSAVSVTGPGGSSIQRSRYYFSGACFRCKEVGHMARDCESIAATRGLGSYYSDWDLPATQPTNTLKPLNLGSLSLLPEKDEISEGMNSEEEEEEEEQSEVSSEDTECKSEMEWRNWAELPRDILFVIFKRIATEDILLSVQSVCRPWRQLSHDPALWRCVDLRYDNFGVCALVSMTKVAVDRSKGCMEELTMEYFPTDELMYYVAERATRLRGLHLISAGLFEETLVETLQKLPLLEELEVSRSCCFSDEVIEKIGQACPRLKRFRLDERVCNPKYLPESDSEKNIGALAIANHFKQLRRLRLFANCLTNTGLLAILENCIHLEYLDIRYCFNVDFRDEKLKNKCARIKYLRLPDDSIVDYEYVIDEIETDDDIINPHLSDTDYDFGYGDDGFIDFDYYGFSDLSDIDDNLF